LEKWVATLIATNDWGVGMTHGLTYGYDAFPNPQRLWDHWDKVKAMEDKIWVGTFREVAAYTKEQKHTRLDIRQQKKGLIITPQLDLDKEIFTEPLTMVIQKEGVRKMTARQGKKKLAVHKIGDKFIFDFNPFGEAIKVYLK
jgi:DNA segregation ATPase FtsK/SpoIIIE-like protein